VEPRDSAERFAVRRNFCREYRPRSNVGLFPATNHPICFAFSTNDGDAGDRFGEMRLGDIRLEDGRNCEMRLGDKRGGSDVPNTGVVVKTRPKTRKPAMYKVLMLNDDYTPMEFVVHVLERFFQKTREEATRIMLHVHRRGVGVCGVFTYEVAETKVTQVMDLARQNQHPLQCTIEKE
jgi:ATP-dependent Clp protease adaptor protein ClpS